MSETRTIVMKFERVADDEALVHCRVCQTELIPTGQDINPLLVSWYEPLHVTIHVPVCQPCAREIDGPLYAAWERFVEAEHGLFDIRNASQKETIYRQSLGLVGSACPVTVESLDRGTRFLVEEGARALAAQPEWSLRNEGYTHEPFDALVDRAIIKEEFDDFTESIGSFLAERNR